MIKASPSKSLLLALTVSSLLLTGCQTTFNSKTGVFRNREFDYLHQPVSHRTPLIIPKGVDSPTFAPKNTLPAGPNFYPAETSANMTPPGFSEKVAIPTEAKPAPSSAVKKSSSPEEIKAQIQSLQTQIETLKTKQSSKPLATTDEKSTPSSLPAMISSSLSFDSHNTGLLTINAPFKESWTALQNAVQESGFTLTKIDQGGHIMYVTAPKTNDPKGETQTYLLFVNRKNSATQVSVFTEKGVLDSSENAYSLLSQLNAKLGSVGSS